MNILEGDVWNQAQRRALIVPAGAGFATFGAMRFGISKKGLYLSAKKKKKNHNTLHIHSLFSRTTYTESLIIALLGGMGKKSCQPWSVYASAYCEDGVANT